MPKQNDWVNVCVCVSKYCHKTHSLCYVIHLNRIFHDINQPAIKGYPMTSWKPLPQCCFVGIHRGLRKENLHVAMGSAVFAVVLRTRQQTATGLKAECLAFWRFLDVEKLVSVPIYIGYFKSNVPEDLQTRLGQVSRSFGTSLPVKHHCIPDLDGKLHKNT